MTTKGKSKRARRTVFDVDVLLARLDRWCAAQKARAPRIVRGAPLEKSELAAIPTWPTQFPFELPTPYDPQRFVPPKGYLALLERAGGLALEYDGDDGAAERWNVLHLYRPGPCRRAHSGTRFTLCDSWSPAGTTVDDREITTTDLLSFASAGLNVEASRWCFFIGGEGPPTIFLEDNDYECLTGRYVDTGEWLSDLTRPAAPSFEVWFTRLVEVVTARPFDPERTDALVNELLS